MPHYELQNFGQLRNREGDTLILYILPCVMNHLSLRRSSTRALFLTIAQYSVPVLCLRGSRSEA
jgi:hypothetical protein